MKILIVKSSSMGDIIHALPAAHDIHAALPEAQIDWVAEEAFADIPKLSPAVSTVHVTAFRRWRKSPFSARTREEVSAVKQALRAGRYDLVLDIQGLMRSALAASWTGVPVTGYTRKTVREPLASFFYQRKLNLPESLGAVRRYRMAAAEALGYALPGETPVFCLRAQGKVPLEVPGKTAAFAVNTSRDEKLWPEENWIALGQALEREGYTPVLYWGSARERERCERIAAGIASARIAPRARLADVAAGLSQSALMVGVDTGLAHLAAALGVPSVGIFVATPTSTLRLYGDGPAESLGGVDCIPSTEDILAAARRTAAAKANPS